MSDYSIWLDAESNHLFGILTRRDDHGLDALPDTEIMKRWWAHMADIMATDADDVPVQIPLQRKNALDLPTLESPISLSMRPNSQGGAMRFHVQNMTCGGCARGVTAAVQSVDPEAGIKIDRHNRFVDLQTVKPGSAFVTAL